jgi:hypothetical protein
MAKECLTCKTNQTTKWYSGPLCRQCYRKLPHVKQSELASSRVCSKVYREKNKITLARKNKEWKENNTERAALYQKEYRRKNKHKKNELEKERRMTDVEFKLVGNLRRRLNIALKKNVKTGSAVRDLGCSIEQFKAYIESMFQSGMDWNNWSRHGWHIDHIRPLSNFDLLDAEQLKMACHYTNLQPLWATSNLIKGSKYE